MAKKTRRKKIKKVVKEGRFYIKVTFNNTIISFTDMQGNVIFNESAGTQGYKGTRKATPYAATQVARAIGEKAKEVGLKEAEIYVKGVGPGRDPAIRTLGLMDFYIKKIVDVTPVPHNGCRPPKPRKV